MKADLTKDETARLEALAARQTDAVMRGTSRKDRPRIMLLRVIEAGLLIYEQDTAAAESKAGGS